MESYLRLIAVSLGLAISLAIVLWAFDEGGARYVLVPLGGEIFTLEAAEKPELRLRGLRGRSSVAENGGMLVQVEKPTVLSYSTKYTPFAIDVLYLDANDLVIAVDHLKANDDRLTASTSTEPVLGALLLPGGTATRLAIRPGYFVQFGRKRHRNQNYE